MANRLLHALGYPGGDTIDIKDKATFRKVVVWLENTKIQQAPDNIVNSLSNVNAPEWEKIFDKYKQFLGCPEILKTDVEILRWIAGYAIQEEYHKNKEKYTKKATEPDVPKNVPEVKTENPLDKLDFRSPEFIEGITKVAKLLRITPHPDPIITLKAVELLVTKRLNQHAIQNPSEYIVKGTPYPLEDADLGFDISDPVLKEAAKCLRVLYIQDLRDLQTKINELIVAVQNITANPKTDTRLGKVGF